MPRQSQHVVGEYTRVGQWTKNPELLESCYFTPITESEAENLVKSYFPDANVIFYPDIRAEAVQNLSNFYIRLPNNHLTEEDIRSKINYPRLQLGVVLHEIAHLKAGLYYGHSQKFVDTLDQLAEENKENKFKLRVSGYIETQNSKKKIAKSVAQILKSNCPFCGKAVKEISSTLETDDFFFHQLDCGHLMKVEKVKRISEIELFKSIKGESLYNFQKENVEKFKEANGRLCIFDEMGLGKTPSSIAISHVYQLFPALIICKSGLRHQWRSMLHYWGNEDDDIGLPRFSVQIIENAKDIAVTGNSFYIVSYDLLPALKESFFEKVNLKLAIIDECQHIKNPDSQRTRAVFLHCRSIPNIVFTSGTPIKNNAAEFYPTLHMINPVRFPNKARFVSEFVDTYMHGQCLKYGGIRDYKKFQEVTKSFIIRHTQAEVLPDLPPIRRHFQYVEIDTKPLDSVESEFSDYYYSSKEDKQFFTNILAYFAQMRHITGLAKIEYAFDYATEFLESTDRKLAIFTHHIDVREALVEKLNKYLQENDLRPCLELVGNMDGDEKENLKNKFNFDPSYRILVASTLASGEGHNLQHGCSDAVMMERQWNPANEEQAEFRFKRPGQQSNSINITYLIAEDSVDEDLTEIVEDKRGKIGYSLDGTIQWNQNEILNDLAQRIASRQNRKIVRRKK